MKEKVQRSRLNEKQEKGGDTDIHTYNIVAWKLTILFSFFVPFRSLLVKIHSYRLAKQYVFTQATDANERNVLSSDQTETILFSLSPLRFFSLKRLFFDACFGRFLASYSLMKNNHF